MAGHSHFKNIKRKKEAVDKKKALDFSRASRLIIASVREKGKDPQMNPSLRIAIEKAKEVDMPKENIERAIRRGAGEGEEGKLEHFIFEAFGPGETAFIIEGSTDNKNRNTGEIKEILKKYNGKLADPGSVKWLFDQKGIIEIEKEVINENLMLEIIEEGAEDVEKNKDTFFVYTDPKNIEQMKTFFLEREIKIISAQPGWRAKNTISPRDESYKSLLEELQNKESVEGVYINI